MITLTLLLGMVALGLSWIVAALNVYLRDTAQVLAVALTAWFWLTPIFLSESRLGQMLPGVVTPGATIINGTRVAFSQSVNFTQHSLSPRW